MPPGSSITPPRVWCDDATQEKWGTRRYRWGAAAACGRWKSAGRAWKTQERSRTCPKREGTPDRVTKFWARKSDLRATNPCCPRNLSAPIFTPSYDPSDPLCPPAHLHSAMSVVGIDFGALHSKVRSGFCFRSPRLDR